MSLQYYAAPQSINGGFCVLDREQSHHLTAVARCSTGARVRIFDGKGRAYEAEIASSSQGLVSCKILRELIVPAPALKVTLCFAPVSRQAVEQLLDQCTQLGAAGFQPVSMARCVSDLSKSWENKAERWQSLLTASCKQCGRADIPVLHAPIRFSEALKNRVPALIASLGENAVPLSEGLGILRNKDAGLKELSVFVGPEGGFAPEELALVQTAGAISVALGPYVLRAETACAAVCAAL